MNTSTINRRGFVKIAGSAALVAGSMLAAPHIARAQSTRVRIATTAGTQPRTLSQLLLDLGYLAELDIEPEFVPVADGSKVLASIISGEVDICMGSGFPNILPAIERGGEIKIIAKAQNYVHSVLFSRNAEMASVADLKGKNIGTGSIGAQVHIYMSALLRKEGIDTRDVQFVNIGGSAAIFKAVSAGVVDAGPGEPEMLYETDKYNVHVIGPVWDLLPEMSGQASYVSDRFIAERRDIIVRTLAAYRRLYQYVNGPDSLEAFLKARNTANKEEDNETGTNQWKGLQSVRMMADDLILEQDRVDWMQDLNISLGVQQTKIPFDKITDRSLAEDAIAMAG
jgi:ABC-type nitrate/sulfonate/bicarbonate transport system substrate-binding protein